MNRTERFTAISTVLFGSKPDAALLEPAAVLIGEDDATRCLEAILPMCCSGNEWETVAKIVVATGASRPDYAQQWLQILSVPFAAIPLNDFEAEKNCSTAFTLGCVLGALELVCHLEKRGLHQPNEEFDQVVLSLLEAAVLNFALLHRGHPPEAFRGRFNNAAKAFVRGTDLPQYCPHLLVRLRALRRTLLAISERFTQMKEAGNCPLRVSLVSYCILEELQFAYFGALTLGWRCELMTARALEEKHVTALVPGR
ncbi:MAG: hypothetical protein PHI63_00155 [Patescibacteria group bacterium]|nr:hypothetical protein [Patescibacteria group bacterium]